MRWLALLIASSCGRIGFAPNDDGASGDVHSDTTVLSDLCAGDQSDHNNNGIPDGCDPCVTNGPVGCIDLGTPTNGLPTYAERVWLIAMNALRADPIGYKATYMKFGDATSSNVFAQAPPPVPAMALWSAGNAGADAHAANRVGCTAASTAVSNLCDGTPFATWSASFAPVSSGYFYNLGPFSWAPELPIRVFGAAVCEGPIQFDWAVLNCQTDSNRDMYLGATHTGFAPGIGDNDAMQYSVWDVLDQDGPLPFAYPAPTGGHFIFGTEIHFALNVDAAAPPKAVYLYLDGMQIPMTVALGSTTRGMYRVIQPAQTTCRSYYMVLVDSDGQLWRYPGHGHLITNGEAACADWGG